SAVKRHLPADVFGRRPVHRQILLVADAGAFGTAPTRPVVRGRRQRKQQYNQGCETTYAHRRSSSGRAPVKLSPLPSASTMRRKDSQFGSLLPGSLGALQTFTSSVLTP